MTAYSRKILKTMKQKLRKGYTTGTCAQAATKAAMQMLFSDCMIHQITVRLPGGESISVSIEDIKKEYPKDHIYESNGLPSSVSCAVRKDSGDDPDITKGTLVYSSVTRTEKGICLDGGKGVGRVTKPGLDQPVGNAAINRVPRKMILEEVENACEEAEYKEGISVIISIPEGERLATKTFNPRLGIEGGLSILGTSGIVEPMSEQALLDTIYVDIRVQKATGNEYLIMAPGNYGLNFLESAYGIQDEDIVKCSNYIGQSMDMAVEHGLKGLILAGHIGKLIKVAGGIMNTHSRWADARMDIFAASMLRAGLPGERAKAILDCVTTDNALNLLSERERILTMEQVMLQIEKYMNYRMADEMPVAAIVYSNSYGILGKTSGLDELMNRWKAGKKIK